MAHQLEITADGEASFAYSGKVGSAWHQLGVEMEDLSTVPEILAACRGDYEVHKDQLRAVDPMDDMNTIPTGKSMTWRERVEYAEDGSIIGADRQVLGVVGDDYRVIQNESAVRLGLELAGLAPDSPSIDCAGVLNEGRRFFVTIPLPEMVIDPNGINDRYGRNLVVVTGHDATQALELVNGFTRAVCANTVGAALRSSQLKIKIRHVGNGELPIHEAKTKLGLVLSAEEEFQQIAYGMLEHDANDNFVEKVCDKLWKLPEGANERTVYNHDKRKQEIEVIWKSDRCSGRFGENQYSVFQALTEWMEHRQHIVGKSNEYNRAYRATHSPDFNRRVHKLADLLQRKSPLKSDGWASIAA